jgi:hypothetical protein
MNIEYKITRLEARVVEELDGRENVIKSLVIGLAGTSDEWGSAYRDALVQLPAPDDDAWVSFEDIDREWCEAITDKVVEDRGWKESIEKEIKGRPLEPVAKLMSFQQQAGGPTA